MKINRVSKVNWFAKIDDRKMPNLKQYLRGLRKSTELKKEVVRPYNYYLFYIGLVTAYAGTKYLKHNLKIEFDRRD